jgi:hypothetical protein
LIEITLVISVLLGLVMVLFIGVASYKEGVNRAYCIHNVERVQTAMRSYTNLQEYSPGDTTAESLQDRIIGPGRFIEVEVECPSNGTYSFKGDLVPITGVAYVECSIGEHRPLSTANW